jgi:hypothetical protein
MKPVITAVAGYHHSLWIIELLTDAIQSIIDFIVFFLWSNHFFLVLAFALLGIGRTVFAVGNIGGNRRRRRGACQRSEDFGALGRGLCNAKAVE